MGVFLLKSRASSVFKRSSRVPRPRPVHNPLLPCWTSFKVLAVSLSLARQPETQDSQTRDTQHNYLLIDLKGPPTMVPIWTQSWKKIVHVSGTYFLIWLKGHKTKKNAQPDQERIGLKLSRQQKSVQVYLFQTSSHWLTRKFTYRHSPPSGHLYNLDCYGGRSSGRRDRPRDSPEVDQGHQLWLSIFGRPHTSGSPSVDILRLLFRGCIVWQIISYYRAENI
jgi:hypothetical protein